MVEFKLPTIVERARRVPDQDDWMRVADMRIGSITERRVFAIAAGLIAAVLYKDVWALAWIAAAIAAVSLERPFWRWALARVSEGRPPHLAAAALVFAVAGIYGALSFVLWTEPGPSGDVIGALFLSAIVLSSVLTLRFASILVLAAVTPTALYLGVMPLIWTPPTTFEGALALVISVVFIIIFSVSIWWRMVQSDAAERHARRSAEAARVAAEHAKASEAAFLAGMSRDLRTPMSMVLGAAAMLRRADLKAEERATVDAMLEAGDVLVAVLDDILQGVSAKSETRIKLAAISPAQIARSILGTWRPRAEDKWLELFLDLDPSAEDPVHVDPARVKQILFSLVSNAVRYTDYGGVRVHVAAAHHGDGRRLLTFRVADTGPGLTLAKAEAYLAGRADGGMGASGSLARSRALARAMGGDITVETSPGEGAAFTLTLDVADGASENDEADAEFALQRLAVLIVDDHQMSRQFAASLLRELGAQCVLAESGPAALALLAQHPFDLVLLDINMPEMSGYDVVRALRASGGENAATPVLALTAASTQEDRRRCAASGMQGFVAKPVVAADLFAEVWRVLDERAARRAA